MLIKTRGIVLRSIRFADKKHIVSVFTEGYGNVSYLVSVGKSSRSQSRASLQPLTTIHLTAEHKEARGLQRVKEIRIEPVFRSIPFDVRKSSQALFISELLGKCLREEAPNEGLFRFVHHAICLLDERYPGSHFHLFFMVKLSGFLGFYPGRFYHNDESIFDLKENHPVSKPPSHPYFLRAETCKAIDRLAESDFETLGALNLDAPTRKEILMKMLMHYELHISGASYLQSHSILETVFN